MLFRNSVTGESIYDSDILDEYIFDIFNVDDGLIGGLTRKGTVYLFDVRNSISYEGEVRLDELIRSHEGLVQRTRPLKDLSSNPTLFGIAPLTWSLYNICDPWWNRYWGTTEVKVKGSNVAITDSHGSHICVGRVPLQYAYAFENSIVVVSRDGRIGFLKSY